MRSFTLFILVAMHAICGTASAEDPVPLILANDFAGSVTPATGESLSIKIEMDTADFPGVDADWWLVALMPEGLHSFSLAAGGWVPGLFVTYQGPLFDIPMELLIWHDTVPSVGEYAFYFGVDRSLNGEIDVESLAFSSVNVSVGGGGNGSIWQPSPGTSWQWQLRETIDTSLDVAMYDIDLFDAPASVIDQLHANGRIVICYFSAGTSESWRSDFGRFPASVMGEELPEWAGERWLDVRQIDALGPIMGDRLDLAVEKGCDGVEPDNVDAYRNDSGFPLNGDHQLAYNIWLAEQAHKRGLSVGLKNDLDQIPELEPYFDWALNEQCFQYDECSALLPFIDAGKAVFGVEYELEPSEFCAEANALNLDWLRKNYELDAWSVSCR